MVAQINMIGNYTSANFSIKADSNGNVEIVDPAVVNGGIAEPGAAQSLPRHGINWPDIAFGAHATLAFAADRSATGASLMVSNGGLAAAISLLGNYMAGTFAAAGPQGGASLTGALETEQKPLLSHPLTT